MRLHTLCKPHKNNFINVQVYLALLCFLPALYIQKQLLQIQHKLVKNPKWWETDQQTILAETRN